MTDMVGNKMMTRGEALVDCWMINKELRIQLTVFQHISKRLFFLFSDNGI